MKIIWGFKIGGLQQKILNLVLIFLLALIGVFTGVSIYQLKHLNAIVTEAGDEQQKSIKEVSESTMELVVQSSVTKTNSLQADVADDIFVEIVDDINMLTELAQRYFENNELEPAKVYPPDPKNDGTAAAQMLCEEGIDYTKSEYLGKAAHMSDAMIALYMNNDKIDSCYIGLEDGTHIAVDDISSNKLDENGDPIAFPVRERPWYKGAAEKGDIYFTGLIRDAYKGTIGITCSAPVYSKGKLVGVVGIDIILDEINNYASETVENGSFVCIVNNEGQIVAAPEDNGILDMILSDEAKDLRDSENKELGDFISKALTGPTGLNVIDIDGKEYYMAGTPMSTIGWTVITVVEKEQTLKPTQQMLSEYDRINNEATEKFEEGNQRSKQTILVMVVLIMIFGSGSALLVAGRIVKPVEAMTNELIEGGRTGKFFEMKDIYRTNNEIEILAQSFDDLAKKIKQYIIDITQITKEKERIGTELELARKIQANMLPSIFPPFPERTEFEIYATMTPAKEVGGDFYDFFLIDDDHLGMVMADVSGKGVPAALFMMMSKILINNFAMQGGSPARVLEQTNEVICRNNEQDMFVTVWFGIMEISTGVITAANAGHEYPMIKKANGDYELFKDKHGFVVGGMDGIKFKEYQITLEKGGTLFLYTDGVPEATNSDKELFGTDRMIEVMNKHKDCDPTELLQKIKAEVDGFVGEAEQFDDLTMLCIKLTDTADDTQKSV